MVHNVKPRASWCFPACRALIRSYLTTAGTVGGHWKYTDMAKHSSVPLKKWWESDRWLHREMQCVEKNQKPWLDLGEEGMRVQLDSVTHGSSKAVGIQVECFVW